MDASYGKRSLLVWARKAVCSTNMIFSILLLLGIMSFSILLAPGVHAQSSIDYGDYESLVLSVNISNSFSMQRSPTYNMEKVTAIVESFPIEDIRQKIYSIETSPVSEITDKIVFDWGDVQSAEFSIYSRLKTLNKAYPLRNKTVFPIGEIDPELYPYVNPTEQLDITAQMRETAATLVEGKDDLYEVEYILAEFVRKNIDYDLGTLTADSNQKSSWVLLNRKGVCDEITNLFISLNRALGIPTKYISGMAYSSLDVFDSNWVPHAWVEVYFPGFGWVPYDVTYGQYGFVDAGHIKLSESHDSKTAGVRYNYLGSGIELNPGKLKTDVLVEEKGNMAFARYDFDVSLFEYETKFGSYNLVIVDVTNAEDYYQVADIYMGETQDIIIIEESVEKVLGKIVHRQEVLLRPREKQRIYWRIKVRDDLNENYAYRFPIIVYNSFNKTDTASFSAKNRGRYYEKDFVDEYVRNSQDKSKDINISCNVRTQEVYPKERVFVDCTIDNKEKNNYDVKVCLEDECLNKTLTPAITDISFNRTYGTIGLKNIAVKVIGNGWTKTGYTRVNVMDPPNISINNLTHPSEVGFKEPYSISFELSRESYSDAKNVTVTVQAPLGVQEWKLDELEDKKVFRLDSNGRSMKRKQNNYQITIKYHDMTGREYYREQSFSINSRASFFENIVLWFNEMSYRMGK